MEWWNLIHRPLCPLSLSLKSSSSLLFSRSNSVANLPACSCRFLLFTRCCRSSTSTTSRSWPPSPVGSGRSWSSLVLIGCSLTLASFTCCLRVCDVHEGPPLGIIIPPLPTGLTSLAMLQGLPLSYYEGGSGFPLISPLQGACSTVPSGWSRCLSISSCFYYQSLISYGLALIDY